MIKLLIILLSIISSQKGYSKNINIILKNGINITLSECLVPDLQRLMFNEVTFIINPFIKDENLNIVKNNCKNSLLHQISIEYLNIEEKNEVIDNIPFKNIKVDRFTNDLIDVYVLEGRQLDKFVTFQMFIKDKYHDNKIMYINGWPAGSEKFENYSQICDFLKVFYKNNKAMDLYKQHLKSAICNQ